MLKAIDEAFFHCLLLRALRTFGSAKALMISFTSAIPIFFARHWAKCSLFHCRATAAAGTVGPVALAMAFCSDPPASSVANKASKSKSWKVPSSRMTPPSRVHLFEPSGRSVDQLQLFCAQCRGVFQGLVALGSGGAGSQRRESGDWSGKEQRPSRRREASSRVSLQCSSVAAMRKVHHRIPCLVVTECMDSEQQRYHARVAIGVGSLQVPWTLLALALTAFTSRVASYCPSDVSTAPVTFPRCYPRRLGAGVGWFAAPFRLRNMYSGRGRVLHVRVGCVVVRGWTGWLEYPEQVSCDALDLALLGLGCELKARDALMFPTRSPTSLHLSPASSRRGPCGPGIS